MKPVVVVGAGHSGVQAVASLRQEKYIGPIVLVSDEIHIPYQRPPLSKAYLQGFLERESLALRGKIFYQQQGIDTIFGEKAVFIDRPAKQIVLATGRTIQYSHLVIATGTRARPVLFEGTDLAGVATLRNLDDADRLKGELAGARDVVVIGAGFIGLEFAATACMAGKNVTVVEVGSRVMGRAVSPPISDFLAQAHRSLGAKLLFGESVTCIEGKAGRAIGVRLANGATLAADLVLIGIGVLAEDTLARKGGLSCNDGIVVDGQMRTSDPDISAIGDCCLHPNIWHGGHHLRLESVQNAADQARILALRLVGRSVTYTAVPRFWSNQGDLKLQITGLPGNALFFIVRGDVSTRAFSVFGFAEDTLRSVEAVNCEGDYMAARLLIGERIPLSPAQAVDLSFDLKSYAKGCNVALRRSSA